MGALVRIGVGAAKLLGGVVTFYAAKNCVERTASRAAERRVDEIFGVITCEGEEVVVEASEPPKK